MATTSSESAIEEDAADLVFPPEFEKADTKTLLISEVHILLEHRKQVNTHFSLFLMGTKVIVRHRIYLFTFMFSSKTSLQRKSKNSQRFS